MPGQTGPKVKLKKINIGLTSFIITCNDELCTVIFISCRQITVGINCFLFNKNVNILFPVCVIHRVTEDSMVLLVCPVKRVTG